MGGQENSSSPKIEKCQKSAWNKTIYYLTRWKAAGIPQHIALENFQGGYEGKQQLSKTKYRPLTRSLDIWNSRVFFKYVRHLNNIKTKYQMVDRNTDLYKNKLVYDVCKL